MYIIAKYGLSSIFEYGATISVVDCVECSVLVNQCVKPSCSLGGSTYPETWFCCLTIFIKYFRGLTLFSITNVVVL